MPLYYETEKDEHDKIKSLRFYRRRVLINGKHLLMGTICSIYTRHDDVYGASFMVFSDNVVIDSVHSIEIRKRPNGDIRLEMYPNNDMYNFTSYIRLPKKVAKKTIKEVEEVLKVIYNHKEYCKVAWEAKERADRYE